MHCSSSCKAIKAGQRDGHRHRAEARPGKTPRTFEAWAQEYAARSAGVALRDRAVCEGSLRSAHGHEHADRDATTARSALGAAGASARSPRMATAARRGTVRGGSIGGSAVDPRRAALAAAASRTSRPARSSSVGASPDRLERRVGVSGRASTARDGPASSIEVVTGVIWRRDRSATALRAVCGA